MDNKQTFVLIVDGGCLGNGKANARCYGSFLLKHKDEIKKHDARFDLPECTTSPQAEFGAMIRCLEYLVGLAERMQSDPRRYLSPSNAYIEIRSDNELVVDALNGVKKVKNAKLIPMRDRAKSAFEQLQKVYRNVQLVWMDDKEVKAILGH